MRAGDQSSIPITLTRLGTTVVCFEGFENAEPPVRVELTGPAGFQRIYDPLCCQRWKWIITATMPVGAYDFRAAQSPNGPETTGVLEVVPATEPAVHRTATQAPSGGPGLQVDLAGFAPGSNVAVFLYGPESDEQPPFPFARPLPVATVDGNGEGTYAVEAQADDQTGTYAIWLNPGPCGTQPCATFVKSQ
jgi:hypothetical protein